LTLIVLVLTGPVASARVQVRIAREMREGSTYAAVYEQPVLERLATASRSAFPYRVATAYAPQVFTPPSDSVWGHLFGPMPAYAWAYGMETVDGYVQFYPENYQRFWSRVTQPALASDKAMRDYYWSFGGRVYLFLPAPGESLGARVGSGSPAVSDLADICNQNLLSLANVRYVISPVRLSGRDLVPVVTVSRGRPWPLYVYENRRVLPRYFVVDSARGFSDSTALLTAMGHASLDELRSVAFLRTGDAARLSLGSVHESGARVHLDKYAADDVTLSATASVRSVLVCTMNYSPYWRAYVDGRKATVMLTDSTFMGVAIPGGTHRVEFRYEPPYAWLLPY
jgi:hypothetical protein